MTTPESGIGSAEIMLVDGNPRVTRADDRIAIAPELLATATDEAVPVDSDGCIWLAGDPRYRYRPVCFGEHRTVICVRVT